MIYKVLLLGVIFCFIGGILFFHHQGMNVEELSRLIIFKCPLKFVTGWSCPTCGLGRSLIAALLLDFKQSIEYHPFGLVLIGGLVSRFIRQFSAWIFDGHREVVLKYKKY
jgi:hypothetical protein